MTKTLTDIEQRLAKIKFIDVKPDFSSLSENDFYALGLCAGAVRIITMVYRQQECDEIGNSHIRKLSERTDEEGKLLFKYACREGGLWDSSDGFKSFVPGAPERNLGGMSYPEDLTKDEWNTYRRLHPRKTSLISPYTAIRWKGDELVAVPYSRVYGKDLRDASRMLDFASDILPNGPLKTFLEIRSQELLTNKYFDGDMAWVDLDGSPFEMNIGPYEVYHDQLGGLKARFQAFIGIKDEAATRVAEMLVQPALELSEKIVAANGYDARGSMIPMVVVRDVYRGGELAFGRQFTAQSLPNDRRVHAQKGSRKVLSALMLEEKPRHIIIPIADALIADKVSEHLTPKHFADFVTAHEIGHSIGPVRVAGEKQHVEVSARMSDLHSIIEEAKADTLAIRLLNHCVNRGLLDESALRGSVAMLYALYFSEFRRGHFKGHAGGNLIEYNFLREHDAFKISEGYITINYGKTIEGLWILSKILMKIQSVGDYPSAQAFVRQYSTIPPEIEEFIEVIGRFDGIPLDVHFNFHLPF